MLTDAQARSRERTEVQDIAVLRNGIADEASGALRRAIRQEGGIIRG
jgi:hypothetical protein